MIREVRAKEDAAALAAIYNEYVLHTTISFETEGISEARMAERIANLERLLGKREFEPDWLS